MYAHNAALHAHQKHILQKHAQTYLTYSVRNADNVDRGPMKYRHVTVPTTESVQTARNANWEKHTLPNYAT